MNLPYLVPRVIRHLLPAGPTRFLLARSLIIRPGLETAEPETAAARYIQVLESLGRGLAGLRVLVFGYGGRFDVGAQLLERGAGQVVLSDKFAPPDEAHNSSLLPRYREFLRTEGGRTIPRDERLIVLRQDIRDIQGLATLPRVDLVVSTSVYEHLQDVEATTSALAALTQPRGIQVHFVDLRDHYFRYPFEMLHYSERTWRTWLNPTSNHNRFRLWDYRRVFLHDFAKVEIEVLERDEAGFTRARPRIRPEFISGDIREDSVTLIRIIAQQPRIGLRS